MPSDQSKEQLANCIKSMQLRCATCNNPNPIEMTVLDYDGKFERFATAFFICPECKNKYMITLKDLGRTSG